MVYVLKKPLENKPIMKIFLHLYEFNYTFRESIDDCMINSKIHWFIIIFSVTFGLYEIFCAKII